MFSPQTFTLFHVLVSVAGIISGLVVAGGLASGRRLGGWGSVFLVTTLATSVTGFGFPSQEVLPSHVVGILSLVILAGGVIAQLLVLAIFVWLGAAADAGVRSAPALR